MTNNSNIISLKQVISTDIARFNSGENVCRDIKNYINASDSSGGSDFIIDWRRKELIKKESLVSLESCLSSLLNKGYILFDIDQKINICSYKTDSLRVNDLLRFSSIIFVAIKDGNIAFLEMNNESCKSIKYGKSLYDAASKGDLDLAKSSVNKGADINFFNSEVGGTALYIAAQSGYVEIVKYLIDCKADLEIKSVFGLSPLYVSVVNRKFKVAQLLLQAGASTESSIPEGYTALCVAAAYGYKDFIELLLGYGAKVNPESIKKDVIGIAEDAGYNEIAQLILNDQLFTAVQLHNFTKAEEQIVAGANVNAIHKIGATLIYVAAQNGDAKIIDFLLKNNADTEITWDHQTPLFAATTNKYTEAIELLLKVGADTEAKHPSGSTPLYVAVNHGDLESIKMLLKYEADVEVKVDGYPMIYVAVNHGETEIVKLFLEYNANIDFKINGFNILYIAAKEGFIDIVEMLVKVGININEAQINGKTALDVAAENSHTQIVKTLINSGANIGFTQKLIFKLLLAEEKHRFDEVKDIKVEHCLQENIDNADYVNICGLDKFSGDDI